MATDVADHSRARHTKRVTMTSEGARWQRRKITEGKVCLIERERERGVIVSLSVHYVGYRTFSEIQDCWSKSSA